MLSEETLSSLKLETGSLVRVTSRRGAIVLEARASSDMRPGDAFVAMHWGTRFTSAGTNTLTLAAFDPHSRQAELNDAAVRIEPFATKWRGTFTAPASAALQRSASSFFPRFDYAAISLAEGPGNPPPPRPRLQHHPDPRVLSSLEGPLRHSCRPLVLHLRPHICACFKVPESTIRSAIAAAQASPSFRNS